MLLALLLLWLVLFTLIFSILSIKYYHRIWNPIFIFIFMIFLGILLVVSDNQSSHLEESIFWILTGQCNFTIAFMAVQSIFNRSTTKDYSVYIKYNWKFVNHALTFCI